MNKNIADTPNPPYYAVIFTSMRTGKEHNDEYESMNLQMCELAKRQDGFLGMESARQEVGITVSYWRDTAAIASWKRQAEHVAAQQKGKAYWYACYRVRIAKVERNYYFERKINR